MWCKVKTTFDWLLSFYFSCIFLKLLFFPGYRYWVHWKTVKATFSRLLSSKIEESFLVFVLWNSAENSPFKVNVFTKRYTVSVKWRDNRHDYNMLNHRILLTVCLGIDLTLQITEPQLLRKLCAVSQDIRFWLSSHFFFYARNLRECLLVFHLPMLK